MMKRRFTLPARALAVGALICALAPQASVAQPAVPGAHFNDWYELRHRDRDGWLHEFNLINYFFVRGTLSNSLPDPSGLRGVSMGPIGSIVGSATRVGQGESYLIEQRWIPVISFSPFFTSGWASFRAMFEVDFGWGYAANATGQNLGGGLNADQVNIQTKAVYAAIFPTQDVKKLSIQLGTQPIYDSVLNPHTTSVLDIVRTGYKLTFVGTDATAAALYSSYLAKVKLAFVPMGQSQPHKATDDDPSFSYAFLFQADVAYPITPATLLGLSYWRLQDDTQGRAFTYEGLVNSGPGSGALASFTGTAALPIDKPSGHVNYLGLNFHHDLHFNTGDWAVSGFVMLSFGSFETESQNTLNEKVDLLGLAANIEVDWNWGLTRDDLVTLELLYATGDDDLLDDQHKAPFTLNHYGLPGAVWFNHRCLILFPFTSTISNYTGAVTDISNQGYGLATAILTGSHDVLPHKLNVKLGGALAFATADPQPFPRTDPASAVERGRFIGAELNVEVRYHLRYLMTVGLHAGYMFKGDFYDGSETVTSNPWSAFSTFTWYAF